MKRNAEQLRDTLCDVIDDVRGQQITHSNANAVAGAVTKIFSSVKLEMQYHKLIGRQPYFPFFSQGRAKPAAKKAKKK